MGKVKLARIRKHSHYKYKCHSQENTVNNDNLPQNYRFILRDVPNAVLNDPSIYNYSQLFTNSLSPSGNTGE